MAIVAKVKKDSKRSLSFRLESDVVERFKTLESRAKEHGFECTLAEEVCSYIVRKLELDEEALKKAIAEKNQRVASSN